MNILSSWLNRATLAYGVAFLALFIPSMPRQWAFVLALIAVSAVVRLPVADALRFCIRIIPFSIALPFSETSDQFALWRIIVILLAGRVFIQSKARAVFDTTPAPLLIAFISLLVLATTSLATALWPWIGLKRIIYLVNAALLGLSAYALLQQKSITKEALFQDIAIGAIGAMAVGYVQLLSTYLMDIYQFMRLWGEHIQLRQFGSQWSTIAVWVGNTWFAYFGDQLSLRLFSVFPDSHSFPTYLVLALPALVMVASSFATRARRASFLCVTMLAIILSGTRGIWLAGILTLASSALVVLVARKRAPQVSTAYRKASLVLLALVPMFLVAFPIFASPQFLLSKGDTDFLRNRIRSIIDLGETSNGTRILIWKASIASIADNPLLGVGIGNFPSVLGQSIVLARAGSTAHNLYLHVPAEMGIPAGIIAFGTLVLIGLRAFWWSVRAGKEEGTIAALTALSLLWMYIYVGTDPIIFDERILLLFGVIVAITSHAHATSRTTTR